MMKNSKLSKLLVAGVSVAMLASALAPMAFAEDSGVATTATERNLTVNVAISTNPASTTGIVAGTAQYKVNDTFWTANTNDLTCHFTVKYVDGELQSSDKSLKIGDGFDWDKYDFGTKKTNKEFTGWKVLVGNWPSTDAENAKPITESEISVDELWTLCGGTDASDLTVFIEYYTNPTAWSPVINFSAVAEEIGKFKVTADGAVKDKNGNAVIDLKGTEVDSAQIASDSSIVIPKIIADDAGYEVSGSELTVEATTNTITTTLFEETVKGGATYTMADLGITSYESAHKDLTNTYTISLGKAVTEKKYVQIKLDTDARHYAVNPVTKKNEQTLINPTKEATGVTTDDKLTVNAYTGDVKVSVDKTVPLPDVCIMDGTEVDEDYTFIGWEVIKGNKQLMADKKTVADSYRFENGEFDASLFYVKDGDTTTQFTLVPVFEVKEPEEDEITYGPAKTPNDKVSKYVNGKEQIGKVVYGLEKLWENEEGNAVAFPGGAFFNEVDGTWAYYTKNLSTSGGADYRIDTDVNGAIAGVVYANGVQDTTVTGILDGAYYTKGAIDVEAYGLKKIAGAEDDPFFYLVSDGVYQSDYNGMWEDEDGSVYKLEKGCTNTTFTGVYDRGDWALSVKDSKVQKDETGFVLYGDTQYWFINGICNMKETEAVRQHTDGNFYYTVGAKIDFTFNGERNGHTFVNGVASK